MTRLASGVSVVRVGAATQIEMIEKKHRIEDAVEAVKAAMDEGIVPGAAHRYCELSARPMTLPQTKPWATQPF